MKTKRGKYNPDRIAAGLHPVEDQRIGVAEHFRISDMHPGFEAGLWESTLDQSEDELEAQDCAVPSDSD